MCGHANQFIPAPPIMPPIGRALSLPGRHDFGPGIDTVPGPARKRPALRQLLGHLHHHHLQMHEAPQGWGAGQPDDVSVATNRIDNAATPGWSQRVSRKGVPRCKPDLYREETDRSGPRPCHRGPDRFREARAYRLGRKHGILLTQFVGFDAIENGLEVGRPDFEMMRRHQITLPAEIVSRAKPSRIAT